MINKVTFFGSAVVTSGHPAYDDAYQTARLLAQNGYIIVDGGGPGVMRAATDGAHAGGGKAIGISFYPKDMMHFEGRDPLNQVDEEIIKRNYVERTLSLIEAGDVFVVFNGGTGTISEFGMAWGLAKLYFGHHKPLILFGSWWHEILEAFGKNMILQPEELRVYRIVTTPAQVLEEIKKL